MAQVKGMLLFFQAVLPFLQPRAKFIFMSSGIATLDQVPDKTCVMYGVTKARPELWLVWVR